MLAVFTISGIAATTSKPDAEIKTVLDALASPGRPRPPRATEIQSWPLRFM